jgi:8-oxo-dGTP diphosphatase
MNYYSNEDKFNLAVDCIIFGFDDSGLKLLLLKRTFEPAKGSWSLMGGFLRNNESLENAATRVLFNLTGMQDVFMEQLGAFGDVERDPGSRVISVAYYALININEYDKDLVRKHNAFWININELPELIFDHAQMVQKALRRLRRKASTQPVGFNLLPEKFTLPQLQRLYEAIYQVELDKRNFRKKILSMDVLEKMEEKDRESSKRGAFLYRFNEEKYNKLVEEGFNFGV